MTDEDRGAIWPDQTFHFVVKFVDSDTTIPFQDISGLDTEAQTIEYRHGNGATLYPQKMPGLGKVNSVTMKTGTFEGQNELFAWFSKIKLNTTARETVTISLMDEQGAAMMEWTLHNAWPTKITSASASTADNSSEIDQLDLAFETMTLRNNNNA